MKRLGRADIRFLIVVKLMRSQVDDNACRA